MRRVRSINPPSNGLTSISVCANSPSAGYKLLAGQRLAQFGWDYFEPITHELTLFGEVGVVSTDNTHELSPRVIDDVKPVRSEIELAGVTPRSGPSAIDVLSRFLPAQHAEAVVRIGLQPCREWSAKDYVRLQPPLDSNNVQTLDLRLVANYGSERQFCLQDLQVVFSDEWIVRLWGETRDCHGDAVQPDYALPGSRVRTGARTAIAGTSTPERLGSLVQDILRHHEVQVNRLTAFAEDWELRFFRMYASSNEENRDAQIRGLQDDLANLREFLSAVHVANKTMKRRAENQPSFPQLVREETFERCDALEQALTAHRGDLRDAFALLAGAAAEQQSRISAATEKQLNTLTVLATYATGLVLVPSLFAALYGANVRGLPGTNEVGGLLVLLLASLVAAVLTIIAFRFALRRSVLTRAPLADSLASASRDRAHERAPSEEEEL